MIKVVKLVGELFEIFGIGFAFLFLLLALVVITEESNCDKELEATDDCSEKQEKRVANHGTDVCQAAEINHPKVGTLGLEDRENDWLARQLRAEAKRYLKKNEK